MSPLDLCDSMLFSVISLFSFYFLGSPLTSLHLPFKYNILGLLFSHVSSLNYWRYVSHCLPSDDLKSMCTNYSHIHIYDINTTYTFITACWAWMSF